jgi:hypothetical protein
MGLLGNKRHHLNDCIFKIVKKMNYWVCVIIGGEFIATYQHPIRPYDIQYISLENLSSR